MKQIFSTAVRQADERFLQEKHHISLKRIFMESYPHIRYLANQKPGPYSKAKRSAKCSNS